MTDQQYTVRATMSLEISSAGKKMADAQTRVFTKWVNARLTQLAAQRQENGTSEKANPIVLCENLLTDLRDGTLLINLTEAVTGKKFRVNKGRTQAHQINNIQLALQCLHSFGVDLTSITEHLINEGNSKATLGLIWKILTFYNRKQMSENSKHQQAGTSTGLRKELLSWCQMNLMRYKLHGVEVTDFGPSWKDGLALTALLHQFKPEQVHIEDLKELAPTDRLEVAFTIAKEEFGVDKLLLPEDLELFPDKETGSGSPRKQLDESLVLTYISELHNQIIKQFPHGPDTESKPLNEDVHEVQEDDVASQTIDHGLTLAPLDSWIKEGQQLMEEELDQEVEREDRDTSPVAKIEEHLQKSDTILSEVSSDIDEHSSSLPPNDAQDLQDRYTELQEQMTNVKKLLTVRLTELKFKECVVDIHHWMSESDSLLTKLKTKDTFGCAEEVEEQLSQYEAVFNEDNATHGHSAVDRLRELAEQLNGFDTWNRRLETRTVVSRESKRVNAMAGGIAEYGELLRVWMNQWETVDRDCALLDGWLSKAELLLGKSEDAETSFALGPQAFMESYQDVLRNYVAHQDLLASLETSMEQVGANANQRAKVETLNKIFRELKQNDLESWMRIYQLFFDKILAWISQADQVESLSVEDSFREKSPPSVCQELLDQLPEVLQAFSECEGKANSDTQCPEWFSEQLMASKLKLSELKEQLEEQLENVQISCEGGEEFKAAVTKLEAKIEKANELTSQDFDSEMSMSVTVAIDKYQVLCDPEWLQDGDNILKEAEEFADQIMKTGKNRGAAQLEQKLVNLSKTWKSTKDKLTSKQRELQFESLQAELDAHMNDGLQLLDGLESVGPLDNLLEQQENYRVLFEEIQFESGAQSYLKKLLELTEEEKQGNPDGELSTYFDQIVSDLREKLTAVMKRAMAMKDKLDESVHKWRTFETEKQEVEVWIKEKGSQLSEITSSCETEWSELDDINRVLQQAMQLTEEIDKYGDWLRRFLDSGEQLKDECDANQSVEHENGLKHLEGRFEQLRLEVDKLTHPLLALQSSWHSFNSLSGEIEAWLDDAHGLLQECSEVEDIKETEQCVKKHKEFFTEPTLKLQNSKITHLSQLLQEFKTPQGGSDQIHHPTHLPDQLQNLIDRYTQICQLQKSELEYLETLWRYLQVATDISQYLHEIELLLSDLDSNSQSPDSLERLQAMLQELMPKRERLGQLKGMHSRLEQIREGRNVPVSLDEMDHRFEEVKARQAAVFERRETEEEAEELISEVKQDIKRARETLTYVIECEAEKENAQIERLQRINSVLNSHKRSISDLIAKLTDRGSTQSCLQNLTDLMSELDAATGELVSAEDICQEASILVDDMKKAVKEVEDQVSKVDTALEIPWRKDSTSRRLALQDCQSAVSGAQMSHQQLNLSEAQRLLNELTTLISPTHVVHVADTLSKSKAEWEAAVKRGHGRIQMIQFEQLMLEAREKINTADAHLKQLEPILGPTSRVEEKLQSHLEFFLDNFETAMDSVRNALATFMESSPSEGDELTKHDVQEKLDELRTQTDTLQSEQKCLELSMKKALAEWQQFDKKQNEFTNWLKGAEKHFEGLRDESSKGNNKEGMLSLVAEIQSKEVSLKLVLDAGHELCQVCIEPNDSHLKQALNELKIQFNQLRSQANAVADAQSDEAEQIEEYRKKAEFVKTWLEDVDKQQRQTKAKEHVGEGDRKVLQDILDEEAAKRQELASLDELFNFLSRNPNIPSQIENELKLGNIQNQFDGSLRAVRLCLVRVMLDEADEVLNRGNDVVGDQTRFEDALEEQEEFFADSNHLGKTEDILRELEASNVGQDQVDGNTQTDTEDLRLRLDALSEKEPQVHSRLASAIAAWKQHDVLYADLSGGAVQCKKELAEFQGIPVAVSPQEVTDRVAQLDNVYEHNKQLFSIAKGLREQIDLLAALATPEQHKNVSNAVNALHSGLEEISRTVGDLKDGLKKHVESANKRAKAVERHCEKLSGRITELDAKVSSLPAIEYDVTPLSDLSQSVDAIQDELEGYRKELEALQQTARDLEGFLDRRVAEQLQALDNQLDNLSAGVAGKDAEVSAAARRTQDVTEKLDAVENTISALNSIVEGDVEDQVDSLESSAIQDYYENVQGCCDQLQKLRPELEDCLKPFPAQGSPATRALETRAEALYSQRQSAVDRGSSQLETLTDIQGKLRQIKSDTKGISLWADKANETLALGSNQQNQLQELKSELEEKKVMLSNVRVTESTLTETYPRMDNQSLSNLMGDVRTKLHKVQDTLTAQFREMSPEENGVEVDMERFDDLYNPVMVFLEDIETRLESQEFDVDVADDIQKIEWKLNHCQAFQSDMDAHTPDYDLVCEKAEELKLGLTESQHPTLDRKLKELNGKWAAVADLLTNRWGGLRDQFVMKLRDTEVVADFERWLNEKKRRLPELTEDESNDPSDILFELEELAVQTSEKRATLEQSNDEGAADLANQFGKFENEVNSAKARQLGEEPQNTLDNIAERIDKWEAQLAVVRDSEDMSPSETAKELSQIEAIERASRELRQELDNLKRRGDSEETLESGGSKSGFVNLGTLDEQLERVGRVMSEANMKRHKLREKKIRKSSCDSSHLLSFLIMFLLLVVIVREYVRTGQDGIPLSWTRTSSGPAPQ